MIIEIKIIRIWWNKDVKYILRENVLLIGELEIFVKIGGFLYLNVEILMVDIVLFDDWINLRFL